ncbi:MAG: hypothetical protein F6J86_07680 [Symploca sp. SIO1B1]|nr:hypothetical protein [Symploca sp. SIO1A3]NER93708.1 hypothetical protein [Symploca sp. SIO1B1]
MYTQKHLDPWAYKPWWCQPWSILLTGIGVISGSWLLVKTVWVTLLITIPILVWWIYFLLLWPKLVKDFLMKQYPTVGQAEGTQSNK